MWFSGLGLPVSILGLAAQVPLEPRPAPAADMVASYGAADFSFTQGAELFSPIDLVRLARPGTGTANAAGDLLIVPVSKYSLEEKKCVCRGARRRSQADGIVQEPPVDLHRAH